MKMIIALNNKRIEEKLAFNYASKYEVYIIQSMQVIIDSVCDNEEYIIVTRYDLKGDIPFISFISEIKEINGKVKFVVSVKELSKEIKEALFAKEIFNIIEGKRFEYNKLIENIESPQMVMYKALNKENKSKIIFVCGTVNSGKTLFSYNLGKAIAKSGDYKVAVLDLDFVMPSLDFLFNGSKNYSLTDYISDVMNKNIKDIRNYESHEEKDKYNIRYFLNDNSLGIPSVDNILKIIDGLVINYDYLVIDTSFMMLKKISDVSKKNGANIVYLYENNEKCIRRLNETISEISPKIFSNVILVSNKEESNHILLKKRIKSKYKNTKSVEEKSIDKKTNINIEFEPALRIKKQYISNKKTKLRCNMNRILKALGIIKYEKLTNRIIYKLLNTEEE